MRGRLLAFFMQTSTAAPTAASPDLTSDDFGTTGRLMHVDSGARTPATNATTMSLGLRINLIIVLVIAVLLTGAICAEIVRTRVSVAEEVKAANRATIKLLQNVLKTSTVESDPEAVVRFFTGMGRVRAQWITLYDDTGRQLYRSPPSLYKAGRDAPAWFTALVRPLALRQDIQVGRIGLVIESDPSRPILDAWDGLLELSAAGLGGLLAIVAMVFWAVNREVHPFYRIVHGLRQLQGGDFSVAMPRFHGREAQSIGVAFNQLAGALQENIESRQRAFEAERRLADSRALASLIEDRMDSERREIARALHDELGQSVTAIRSLARSISLRAGGMDAQVGAAAKLIGEEAGRLYDQMHGMIPRLAPMTLDSLGLDEALKDLVQRVRLAHPGVRIAMHCSLEPRAEAGPAAQVAYRIVQEAITNAIRHGGAGEIEILIECSGEWMDIRVADTGRGLAPNWRQSGHFGLRWLTDKAQALGGNLELMGRVQGGAELLAALPLHT